MSVQSELNRADINRIADLLRNIALGDIMQRLAADLFVEETVTVTANVGVLSARALAIAAITVTAGTTTGSIIPYSATVAAITKTCQIGTDRKTLTFFATDAVTTAKVTYLKAPTRASDSATLESLLAATFQGA